MKLDNTYRLCLVCLSPGNVVDVEQERFHPDRGVVRRVTVEHDINTHTFEESRLPLDDPRNVSPIAREERITH